MRGLTVFIIMSLLIVVGAVASVSQNVFSVAEQKQEDNSNYNNVRITLENSNVINLEKEKVNNKEIKVSIENNNPYPVCLKIHCESSLFHTGHGGLCVPSKSVTETIPSICLNGNEKTQTWISIVTTEEIREADYEANILVDSATSRETFKEIPLEIFVR